MPVYFCAFPETSLDSLCTFNSSLFGLLGASLDTAILARLTYQPYLSVSNLCLPSSRPQHNWLRAKNSSNSNMLRAMLDGTVG